MSGSLDILLESFEYADEKLLQRIYNSSFKGKALVISHFTKSFLNSNILQSHSYTSNFLFWKSLWSFFFPFLDTLQPNTPHHTPLVSDYCTDNALSVTDYHSSIHYGFDSTSLRDYPHPWRNVWKEEGEMKIREFLDLFRSHWIPGSGTLQQYETLKLFLRHVKKQGSFGIFQKTLLFRMFDEKIVYQTIVFVKSHELVFSLNEVIHCFVRETKIGEKDDEK